MSDPTTSPTRAEELRRLAFRAAERLHPVCAPSSLSATKRRRERAVKTSARIILDELLAAPSPGDALRPSEEFSRYYVNLIKMREAVEALPRWSKDTSGQMGIFDHGAYLERDAVLALLSRGEAGQ